jgi:hypothetical protein
MRGYQEFGGISGTGTIMCNIVNVVTGWVNAGKPSD